MGKSYAPGEFLDVTLVQEDYRDSWVHKVYLSSVGNFCNPSFINIFDICQQCDKCSNTKEEKTHLKEAGSGDVREIPSYFSFDCDKMVGSRSQGQAQPKMLPDRATRYSASQEEGRRHRTETQEEKETHREGISTSSRGRTRRPRDIYCPSREEERHRELREASLRGRSTQCSPATRRALRGEGEEEEQEHSPASPTLSIQSVSLLAVAEEEEGEPPPNSTVNDDDHEGDKQFYHPLSDTEDEKEEDTDVDDFSEEVSEHQNREMPEGDEEVPILLSGEESGVEENEEESQESHVNRVSSPPSSPRASPISSPSHTRSSEGKGAVVEQDELTLEEGEQDELTLEKGEQEDQETPIQEDQEPQMQEDQERMQEELPTAAPALATLTPTLGEGEVENPVFPGCSHWDAEVGGRETAEGAGAEG